jgi:hypothetical protein
LSKTHPFLLHLAKLALGLLLAGSVTAPAGAVSPTSAQIELSPASGSYPAGTNVDVQVRVSTSATTNAVQAVISYPADKLQYTSIDATGSAFDVAANSSGGGGTVTIVRGHIGGLTGTLLLATIKFAVLKSGSADIAIGSGSAVVSSTTNTNLLGSASVGAHYLLTGVGTKAAPGASSTLAPTATTPAKSSSSAWLWALLALVLVGAGAGALALRRRQSAAPGIQMVAPSSPTPASPPDTSGPAVPPGPMS